MKQHILLLVVFIIAAGMLSAQATNLIISEYVEGTSYQKAIEIFNGTGTAVDLSTVSLKKQTNGAGAFGSELVLSGTLANNDVYVIVNSTSGGTNLVGQPFVDLATTSQAVNFNGNDAVGLFRNGNMIDVVGIVDDSNIWGQDMTLVRNANIASPSTTFSLTDWSQYPVNTFEYLGMHTFTGGTTDPVIIVTYPNTAVTWYLGYTYTLTWSSANFDGNVNIGIMNGDVLTVIEGSDTNDGSYNWTVPANYTTGNQFRIRIASVNGAVGDTSDTYFSIIELPVNDVTDLAQLRAGTPDGTTIYRVTGSSILSYQQTYRHKKYFQDASAGIEIDDPNGIVTSVYQIGDEVSGLIGTLSTYNNLLQFTPFANFPEATSSGNAVSTPVVTISELNTAFETYESRLVQINNASFVDPGTFATGTAYNVSDATGQIVFRTNFFEADYIDQPIPSGEFNLLAITTQYGETYQVTARSMADFTPVSNQDENQEAQFGGIINAYPNPFIQSTNVIYSVKDIHPLALEIYNVRGQLIRSMIITPSKSGENTVAWDARDNDGKQVSGGIYIFKLQGNSASDCRKVLLLK